MKTRSYNYTDAGVMKEVRKHEYSSISVLPPLNKAIPATIFAAAGPDSKTNAVRLAIEMTPEEHVKAVRAFLGSLTLDMLMDPELVDMCRKVAQMADAAAK